MCDPMTAIAVASSAFQFQQQQAQASAQKEHQEAVYERNKQQAMTARNQKTQQEHLRQMQEREAAEQKMMQQGREADQARARARVSAAESGVSGNSVDQLLADFNRQENEYMTALNSNFEMSRQQSETRKEMYRNEQNSRVTNAQPSPVNEPNMLAGALRIGATGYQTRQQYKLNQQKIGS